MWHSWAELCPGRSGEEQAYSFASKDTSKARAVGGPSRVSTLRGTWVAQWQASVTRPGWCLSEPIVALGALELGPWLLPSGAVEELEEVQAEGAVIWPSGTPGQQALLSHTAEPADRLLCIPTAVASSPAFLSPPPGSPLPAILHCDSKEIPPKQSKLMLPPCPTSFTHPGPPHAAPSAVGGGCLASTQGSYHLHTSPPFALTLCVLCPGTPASPPAGSPAAQHQSLVDCREWLLPPPSLANSCSVFQAQPGHPFSEQLF